MNETMTKISSTTLAASQSAITFSNIPQTYSDLKVVISARNANNNYGGYQVRLNGLTTGSHRYLRAYNGTSLQTGTVSSMVDVAVLPISSDSASVFSTDTLYIPDYTSAHDKVFYLDSTRDITTADSVVRMVTGYQISTIPVTSLIITLDTDSFAAQSTFTLYGIKNSAKTFANSVKASGGSSISTDGTYVYHTYTSSQTFTPFTNLLLDYVVVAGGGGGTSGGGGAGGLRTNAGTSGGGASAENKFIALSGTSYTVTVGAGGNGGYCDTANGAIGTNGSDSAFATITSTGGGTGGQAGAVAGATQYGRAGGSGGGAAADGGATNSPGGTGVTGQGNAGAANGTYHSSPYGVGGGGGAGGVAPAITGNYAGPGGPGLLSPITNTYLAGGGGGGGYVANTTPVNYGGSGIGGNGAQGSSPSATAGTINTGSGGGGGSGQTAAALGGAGGSGIVVVRYKA